MVHLIAELSKYLMIILFAAYTFFSYSVLKHPVESERAQRIYHRQTACMFLIHLDAYIVIFVSTMEIKTLIFYAAQVAFVLFLFIIYKKIYKRAAQLIVNHMCMLMLIGFIILTRLGFDSAVRQFEIGCISAVITIFIPLLIRKMKALRRS